jgi:hypothetical protein
MVSQDWKQNIIEILKQNELELVLNFHKVAQQKSWADYTQPYAS